MRPLIGGQVATRERRIARLPLVPGGERARRGLALLRRGWPSLALLGPVLLYLYLLWPRLDAPLVYDDVNFAFAARAVAETGLPFANAGYMSDRWDFSQREQWALWHPPLYVELLGLQFRLFGGSERSARLVGLACGLGTAGLVYLIGRGLVGARGRAAAELGLVAAAFYLLSPLTLESALILDIDGTVLTLLLTLMVYVLVRWPAERSPRSTWALGGLFALSLWAKLTTPLGLLACLVLFRLLGRQARQAAREALIVGVGGLGLFLATWGAACLILGMPFEMPFAVTWIELLDASATPAAWLRSADALVEAAAPGLLWAGPYLGLLAAAAAVWRLREFLATWRLSLLDLAIGFSAVVFVVYLIKLAGYFPKYQIAVVPFWGLAAAALVRSVVGRVGPGDLATLAAGLAVFAWYFGSRVSPVWVHGAYEALGLELWFYPSLLGGLLLAAYHLASGRGVARGLAIVLTAAALAWGPAVELPLRRADYSTTYFFGTRGQREAAGLLDSLTGREEFYAGAKEVAWYAANQRYIDQDTLNHALAESGHTFSGQLVGHDVRVLALWSRPIALRDYYRVVLSPGYEPLAERGDYTIWVRRG